MNPFSKKILPPKALICDRQQELKDVIRYAENQQNMVLFSPRRYGKTSLVLRAQHELRAQNFLTIYADLFSVDSLDDLAAILAKAVYKAIHAQESLLDKGKRWISALKSFRPVIQPTETGLELSVTNSSHFTGKALLEQVMEDIGNLIIKKQTPVHIALDEFQEISRIKAKTEEIMRSYIQTHQASYCFIGSRRSMLLQMFNQSKRPFFQSAFNYPLPALPQQDMITYLQTVMHEHGRDCSVACATKIADISQGYAYYLQLLGYFCFERSSSEITDEIIAQAFDLVLESEAFYYQANIESLSTTSLKLIKALARQPTKQLLSAPYLSKLAVSASSVAYTRKQLEKRDLIEEKNGYLQLVDPFMAIYLQRH
ncbi:MAG: ATP-binding protein [Desulfoplanes sp.]|nr:ATP-binding protein [Desulfoplanes sp.]